MHAALWGDLAMCAALLDAGANVHARNTYHYTALFGASMGNHIDVIHLLVKHGARVDARDKVSFPQFSYP